MKKTSVIFVRIAAFLAVVAGCAAAYLRSIELTNVFDADSGLADFPNRVSVELILLSVLIAVIGAVAAYANKLSVSEGEELYHRRTIFGWITLVIPGLAMIAAVYPYVMAFLYERTSINLLAMILTLIAAIAFFVIRICEIARRSTRAYRLFSLLIIFWSAYRILACYRNCSADSVILHYVYQLLFIIGTSLLLYWNAKRIFDHKGEKTMLLISILVIYLSVLDGGSAAILAYGTADFTGVLVEDCAPCVAMFSFALCRISQICSAK